MQVLTFDTFRQVEDALSNTEKFIDALDHFIANFVTAHIQEEESKFLTGIQCLLRYFCIL